MLTDSEVPFEDWGGQPIDRNFECEFCGRSMEARFGGVPPTECDSCAGEFTKLNDAGKLGMDGWSLVVLKIGEDDESA